MIEKEVLHKRCLELYNNKSLWLDPYDSETYRNRYIRKAIKILLDFIPNALYNLKIIERHIWPENLELLGKCFLLLNDVKNAERVYLDLLELSENKYYWGLPIGWYSSKYVFPPGSMMSTTTAEIALFIVDLSKKSDIVEDVVLKKIAYNLLDGLSKVFEDEHKLILGYTAYDDYRVNNSNLLVAAALYRIGKIINDNVLINAAAKITNACLDGISDDGGVPYYMNGNIYDSYHQIFSLRALYYLKEISAGYESAFNRALSFLEAKLMDKDGNVYLTTKKNRIDMQGTAEALGFYSLLNNIQICNKVLQQIDNNLKSKNGEYVQRRWIFSHKIKFKSRTLHTRQGEIRLYIGKILYSLLCNDRLTVDKDER